jgi:ubiquitin-activating enzyme E1
LNKFCRSKNVGFIYAGNLGLYGFAFVDFGDKHLVSDVNGEEPRQIHINLITS